jgi:NDP-sugar pyrophosphorylase family protein
MEYSIYDAIQAGFSQVVVITKKENVDTLTDYLAPKLNGKIRLDVVAQELSDLPDGIEFPKERVKPWGTAHAVWAARHVIDDPFVIINADDFYGNLAYQEAANFINSSEELNEFALVAYELGNTLSDFGTVSRGVCESDDEYLTEITETLKLQADQDRVIDQATEQYFDLDTPVSMNFWINTPVVFDEIEKEIKSFFEEGNALTSEVFIPKVMSNMMHEEKVKIRLIKSKSNWFGVTYAEDKQIAIDTLAEFHEQGAYPDQLWA